MRENFPDRTDENESFEIACNAQELNFSNNRETMLRMNSLNRFTESFY